MKNKIYHNPQCSKSRETLQLLNEKNAHVEIIEYLKTPPSAEELKKLCSQMGIPPKQLIRFKEAIAKELGISKSTEMLDSEWCQIMSDNPKLIERPIVVFNGKVILGRPPQKVLEIL